MSKVELFLFKEVHVPVEMRGKIQRSWQLKRDKSARFVLGTDGKMYIVGNKEITETFTDQEWLECMKLENS
jgi:hypothetical protein